MWHELLELRSWSSPDTARQKRVIAIWAVVCCALVLALYYPILSSGYRGIGVDEWVINNAIERHGILGAAAYFDPHFWGHELSGRWIYYRPLAFIAHAIDYRLWGINPALSHAVNLALFAFDVVLFAWLIAVLAGSWVPAMLAATLFVVLPSNAEPVSWIAARMELLSGAIVMGSMISLVLAHKRKTWPLAAISVLLFVMAVLVKETAGMLVAVVAVWALMAKRGTRRLPMVTAGVMSGLGVCYVGFRYATGTIVVPPQVHHFYHLAARMHAYYLSKPLAKLYEAVTIRSFEWVDFAGLGRGLIIAILMLPCLPAAILMLVWRVVFYLPALPFVQASDRYLFLPEMGSLALFCLALWQTMLWLRRYRPYWQWLLAPAYLYVFVVGAKGTLAHMFAWKVP